MGALLSSTPPPPPPTPRAAPTRHHSYVYETQRPAVRQSTPQNIYENEIRDIWRNLQSLSIQDPNVRSNYGEDDRRVPSRQVAAPVKSIRNPDRCLIRSDPYFDSSATVTYIKLQPYDPEYLTIMGKITNKRKVIIDSIEKIENPYLKRAYQLKKEQKEKQYFHVEEKLLFHGTTRANVDKICKFNFDWRLCKAHKYGKGVSFSPNATYASNYSDKYIHNKVMIVAKVMISSSCIGNDMMVLPPSGCDTSQKGADGIVIVKYEDNEYLPVYKINYHLAQINTTTPRQRTGARRSVPVLKSYYDYSLDDDFFD